MKKNIIIISTVILSLIIIFIISLFYIENKNNNVDNNYKLLFRGENIDNIYTTYVYKEKKQYKKKKIIIYKYINTIIVKNNLDYTYSLEKIVNKGSTKDIDKIYDIAKENNAITYVEIPKEKLLIRTDKYKEYLN